MASKPNRLSDTARVLILGILINGPTAQNHAASAPRAATTIYPSRYFEIRNHDAPTKYVFDGTTRIARVTGSLSHNQRIQRLRLYPGWNLCSLAVTAPNALAQLRGYNAQAIGAVYRWIPESSLWTTVSPGELLAAGTVFWVNALTNAVIAITGAYAEPTSRAVPSGGSFLSSAGLEAWPLSPALPPDLAIWSRAALTNQWLPRLPTLLPANAALPACLAPGEAVFVQSDTNAVATPPDPGLRICYYHQDHLGSSSVITDARGTPVEEMAYYPFGGFRNQSLDRGAEDPYHFTEKETDRESGLQYFGKRFYQPGLARWLSTDPKQQRGGSLNLYAYAKNNPLKYEDPDGGEITIKKTVKSGITTYTIHLEGVIVSDAKKSTITQDDLEAYRKGLTAQIIQSYQGKEGSTRWQTTVDLKVVDKLPDPKSKSHVFKIVDATVHGAKAAGTAWRGGRTMEIETKTFFGKKPRPEASEAERKAYESAETVGAHEFGHTAGLPDTWGPHKGLMSEDRWYDDATITVGELQKIISEEKSGHINLSDEDASKLKR